MNQEPQTISAPVAKGVATVATAASAKIMEAGDAAGSMFADLFVMTWPNIAAAAAALFSLSMLCEWWWKKFWRPVLERLKWIKPKKPRRLTAIEIAELIGDRDTDPSPLL